MTTTHPATATQRDASKKGVARTALLATLAAVATNLSLFGLARALGVDFAPARSAQTTTVGPAAVLAATLVAMSIGWVAVALATRRHRSKLPTMAIIGGLLATLSTLAPLTLDTDIAAKLTLASLHLITGTFYVIGVAKLVRADSGEAQ